MCKGIQDCLESCYWHLIYEKFCFDESIANYQVPRAKEEKNNNLFDNIAFFDSVSVIAGRAVVTIDPLPEEKIPTIVEQPRRLNRDERMKLKKKESFRKGIPLEALESVKEENGGESRVSKPAEKAPDEENEEEEVRLINSFVPRPLSGKKTVSFENILREEQNESISDPDLLPDDPPVELRKKSLRDRRMSKSLSLRLDYPEELPIIRQSSVPKFFLDTPEDNQNESSLIKNPLTALQSPLTRSQEFYFDLKSVVHIETARKQQQDQQQPKVVPGVHRESSMSRLKRNIKLKKSKSFVSSSSIPQTNYI